MRYILFLLFLAAVFGSSRPCFGSEVTLQKAWTHYLNGDYGRSVEVCRKISGHTMLGEEGRYIMGLSLLKLNDLKEARKNFIFILDNYSRSRLSDESLLGVADSYYLEERFDKAKEYYIRLLKSSSGSDYASIAYLRLGESQRKQGQWEEADSSFHKVARDYPLSLEARAANAHLKKKKDFFSVQVGAFSKSDNAQRLSGVLRAKGHDAYLDKTYKEDRLIYRVRVGRFADIEQAKDKAAILKEQGFTARVSP